MPHNVIAVVFFSGEGFPAQITPERSIVRVRSHMVCQMLLSSILLSTNRTMVRRFTYLGKQKIKYHFNDATIFTRNI